MWWGYIVIVMRAHVSYGVSGIKQIRPHNIIMLYRPSLRQLCIIIPRCDAYVTVYPTAKHVYTVVLVFCYCLRCRA